MPSDTASEAKPERKILWSSEVRGGLCLIEGTTLTSWRSTELGVAHAGWRMCPIQEPNYVSTNQ
jgi:hypothetical protein